jgi:hypothetical protein
MGLNWNAVRAEHVTKACEHLIGAGHVSRARAKGLVVIFKGASLPAKEVLRVAYLFATGLPPESKLKFTSGQGTIDRLKALGFVADRLDSGPAQPAG